MTTQSSLVKKWLPAVLVTVIAFFTYVRGFENPPYFFWDENYHVASAQKYLNGVFFMEPHPPLGKLLIALGEALTDSNPKDDDFVGVDHAPTTPAGFSFFGYRLFPVLLAWLTAPMLYFALLELVASGLIAALLTAPYVFENAMIVHNRGAMLEGVQLFFVVGTLWAFLRALRLKDLGLKTTAPLALFFGLAVSVKINALVLGPLFLALPLIVRVNLKTFIRFGINSAALALIPFLVFWYIHFALVTKINPKLSYNGYYFASEKYKAILAEGRTTSLTAFPTMLADSFRFVPHYEKGVPKLNYCKDEENGSYPLFWPLGGGSINYRWERTGADVRYLYLQVNPWSWALALFALVTSVSLLIAKAIAPTNFELKNGGIILTLVGLYFFYLAAVLNLDRVFYLYHYFIPLLLCFVLLGALVPNLERIGSLTINDERMRSLLIGNALLTLLIFIYFSPLTYYQPLKNEEVESRRWLALWDLRCQGCQRAFPLAQPLTEKNPDRRSNPDWSLSIGDLASSRIEQSWGEPRQGRTVDGLEIVVNGKAYENALGVHANSTIDFELKGEYTRFSGAAGMPDYLTANQGSAIFEVMGDGRSLWRSELIHRGDPPRAFDVSVSGVKRLSLLTLDGGDGNNYDHTCWLEPRLTR